MVSEDTRERPVETNLFLVTYRYYSPKLGRFIQPADVSSLNPSSINGLNLYCYANNNPIGIVKLISNGDTGMASGFSTGTKFPIFIMSITNSNLASRKYWDPHAKGKWFYTDWPEFYNFTYDKIEFVNWSFSVYKASFYFDYNENHYLYIEAAI